MNVSSEKAEASNAYPSENAPPAKPLLRGWSHVAAALIALIAGCWLALSAPTTRGRWSSLAFTSSLLIQFCVSGVYHTKTWAPTPRLWLRRADHAAIFLLIAGTYTPICLLALHGHLGRKLLLQIWTSAVIGLLQSLFFVGIPKKVSALLYLVMGWMAVQYAKILGGGILYSLGALAYALKWPDPLPRIFGYHEVFHAFVIFASTVHFAAVANLVLSFDDGRKLA